MATFHETAKLNISSSQPPLVMYEGAFSDQTEGNIRLYFGLITLGTISVFGCLTNSINLMIFLKQGVRDCVGVCLLSLTITDLISLLIGVFTYIIQNLDNVVDFDTDIAIFFCAYAGGMLYDISTCTTAFITIEKCLCIALPFKFKDFVTFERALVIEAIIILGITALFIPHYLTSGVTFIVDPLTNTTVAVLWVSPDRAWVDMFLNIAVHLVIGPVCLIIVLVCTQVMVIGLKRSAKFRSKRTGSESLSSTQVNKSGAGSAKNIAMVKTVMILAIVCFWCNLLRFLMVLTIRVRPDIYFGQPLADLFNLLMFVVSFCQLVNSSVNTFVYYIFNPTFRKHFKDLFGQISTDYIAYYLKFPLTLFKEKTGGETVDSKS